MIYYSFFAGIKQLFAEGGVNIGKSERSDWFFLGRDSSIRTVSMRCVFLLSKADKFKIGDKPTKRNRENSLILRKETT